MNKLRYKISQWLSQVKRQANIRLLNDHSIVIVNASQYASDRLELSNLRSLANQPTIKPATKFELLQKQLGSYIPNLESIGQKPDEFKNALGRLCREMTVSPEFQYLINHLKQDQVNIDLFEEEKNKDFVRGSINGIWIVAEQIQLMGDNYQDRLSKGMIKEKKAEPVSTT